MQVHPKVRCEICGKLSHTLYFIDGKAICKECKVKKDKK